MFVKILDQLGVNETIYYQFGLFIFVFLALKFIFFKPYLKMLQEREIETTGKVVDVDELNAEVEAKEQEYKDKLFALNEISKKHSDQILRDAKTRASTKIEEARISAKNTIENSRKKIEVESEEALESLLGKVHGISQSIVAKLTRTDY